MDGLKLRRKVLLAFQQEQRMDMHNDSAHPTVKYY